MVSIILEETTVLKIFLCLIAQQHKVYFATAHEYSGMFTHIQVNPMFQKMSLMLISTRILECTGMDFYSKFSGKKKELPPSVTNLHPDTCNSISIIIKRGLVRNAELLHISWRS